MSVNNPTSAKINYQDLPDIAENKKWTATNANNTVNWQRVPVQKLTAFVDTDIIIDGTKSYSTTKVVTLATHTITASDDDAIANTLSSEHRQGNNIKARYQFDQDCTITLTNFDTAGNNTGTITPIPAGTYDLQFFANASGVNLDIPQNVHGDDSTKLSKTLAADQEVVSNVEFPKVAINVSTFLNTLDVGGGMAVGSGYAGTQTAPTDGLLVEGLSGFGKTVPTNMVHVYSTTSGELLKLEGSGVNANINFQTSAGVGLFQLDTSGNVVFRTNQNAMYFDNDGSGDMLWRTSFREVRMVMKGQTGFVSFGHSIPAAQVDIKQTSLTAAKPALKLTQADLSEEIIKFDATIATGNPIEAVAAKTLTPTHFIKVNIEGVGIRYIQAGTIA